MKNLIGTIIILTAAVSLYPKESSSLKNKSKKNYAKKFIIKYDTDKNDHVTAYLPLRNSGKYPKQAAELNYKIKDGLKRILFLYLVSDDTMKKYAGKSSYQQSCNTNKCAILKGKKLQAQRVIYGRVDLYGEENKKYYEKMKNEKYLLQAKRPLYYVITIRILSLKERKVLKTIKVKSWPNELDDKIDSIIEKIEKYYERKPVKHKPVYSLNFAASAILPIAKFREFSDIGEGATLKFEMRNVFFKNSIFQISTGYYYLHNKKSEIKHFHTTQMSLLTGYTFPIPFRSFISDLEANVLISPLVGSGYHLHIIEEYNSMEYFADPFVTLQLQFDFKIYKKTYLYLTPGITFFFEKMQKGMYANFDLGFKISF